MEPVTLAIAFIATTAGLVSSLVKWWMTSHEREVSTMSVQIRTGDGEVVELKGDVSAEQIAQALERLREEDLKAPGHDDTGDNDRGANARDGT